MSAIIDVVVVLPWAPATAIPGAAASARRALPRVGPPAGRARGQPPSRDLKTSPRTNTRRRRHRRHCAHHGPGDARAQRRDRSVMSVRCMSDPLTSYPRFTSSSAMPLIPIPPTPIKWMRLACRALRSRSACFATSESQHRQFLRRRGPREPSGRHRHSPPPSRSPASAIIVPPAVRRSALAVRSPRRHLPLAAPARCGADGRRSPSAAAPRIAGRPAAVSSASVVAPARDTTSPATFISRSIASMNRSTRPCTPLAKGLANHVEVSDTRLADEMEVAAAASRAPPPPWPR